MLIRSPRSVVVLRKETFNGSKALEKEMKLLTSKNMVDSWIRLSGPVPVQNYLVREIQMQADVFMDVTYFEKSWHMPLWNSLTSSAEISI